MINETGDDRNNILSHDKVLLVVEDDMRFAKIMIEKAHEKELKVVVAKAFGDVFDLTNKFNPIAVTLDVKLPDASGWKILDLFKNDQVADVLVAADLPAGDKEFLTKLVQVIGERLNEPELSAVFLEKAFSMSKMQLYRKLKTMTGMTPGEFIKHIRLKEAAHLLTTTHYNVTEIFYRTGFNNQSYFFREFKKRYECAPNEYRNGTLSPKGET